MATGYVQSVESGSFVDGPGVRFVVFLSGCPLRCRYCHNPETWSCGGQPTEHSAVLSEIARAASFLKAGAGGVTVSGGEPLAQAGFAYEILRGSKSLGLHTALDTSGYLGERATDELLDVTDLVLLDIKACDPLVYRELTGVDLTPTLRFAERLARDCRPVWVRFVLVPGVTDGPDNVSGLARFVGSLGNVERMEVVPFHQMGRHKWEQLGIGYTLTDTPEPTPEQLADVAALFAAEGLPVSQTRRLPCTPTHEE